LVSFGDIAPKLPKTFRQKTLWIPFAIRILTITVTIIALARPQGHIGMTQTKVKGIDIVISLDISSSMLARDFVPDRMEAAKEIAKEFVRSRPGDRLGFVVFSGESLTLCPLTSDHNVVLSQIDNARIGLLPDGTAIGMGLSTAVARLKDSNAKSKVVILLTDGENNMGSVYPLTAAEIAKTFGVRVYTIGVGTKGKALSPVAMYSNNTYKYDYVDVKIDEPLMIQIAEMTGGQYFRATDNQSLRDIYSEIDKMEKEIIEVTQFQRKPELFFPLALLAFGLFLLEVILRMSYYKFTP
jgi:Ca-activated chloride channel family protein